jgi:protein subunit release factor B
MKKWGIEEKDLIEEFIRGSGPGGQKIQKSSVVVKLFHPPSGIQVRCHQGRSQGLNRYYARKRLVEKIEEKILGEAAQARKKIEKIRRQKRKRSKRAKAKMLLAKKIRGEKKRLRRRPRGEEE